MNLHLSPKALPRNLGILGITLPFILWIGQGLAPSISHYYYSDLGIYFTGVLFAFGLFLYAYKGYKPTTEKISDNAICNAAGICAIATALIPTSFKTEELVPYDFLTKGGPNAHNNDIAGIIHLSCAGLFLIIMGYLAFFRFTMSGKSKSAYYARRFYLYRICGVMVWISIALMAADFVYKHFNHQLFFSPYDVYFGELIALVFFGTAWLVKSQIKLLKYVGLVSDEELNQTSVQ
ncbi:MAG: hypothetical protein HYZ14_18455 [Bacteroidetes bacterium]|nr:hypothetical protein [Bacteroidota bacterium]